MVTGAFPRLSLLLLLLCCWPSSISGLGVAWKNPGNSSINSSLVRPGTVWPLLWGSSPSPRDFTRSGQRIPGPRDFTRSGQRIPGLAKHSKCCGIVNRVPVSSSGGDNKIVNGTATTRDQFPWMAALVRDSFIGGTPLCGGFLINSRYVVTAAHCVVWWPSPQYADVVLRKYEVFQTSPHELRLAIDTIIIHPRYQENSILDNDIALLRLATALDLPMADNSIAPICLPTRSLFIGAEAETAGYGLTVWRGDPLVDRPYQLNSAKMRIVSNGVCAFLNAGAFPFAVDPNAVCAIGQIGGTGSCQGDSGSALMVTARYRKSRRVAVGITSWVIRCAEPLNPDVFARVSWFLDWIVANTQDAEYC